MKNELCCRYMQSSIEDPYCPLKYEPHLRRYILTTPAMYLKKNELSAGYLITYCPGCATKLPTNLAEEWSEVIREKFGITGGLDKRIKKLPEEFRTDEWWKKRGL